MKAVFPVSLENGIIINGNEDSFMISEDPSFRGISGSDANGSRATNIVGFDGKDLLKKCTNPKCEKPIKPREISNTFLCRSSSAKKKGGAGLKLNIKNDNGNIMEFCCGEKEYILEPGEEVSVETKDEDYMYFDVVR